MEEGKLDNYPQFSKIVDGTKATRHLGIAYKDLETYRGTSRKHSTRLQVVEPHVRIA